MKSPRSEDVAFETEQNLLFGGWRIDHFTLHIYHFLAVEFGERRPRGSLLKADGYMLDEKYCMTAADFDRRYHIVLRFEIALAAL